MLSGFHPLVSRWFLETIGEPTPAQRRGWDAIRAGRHTLIAAPTGSGKTLAAFLTAIDDLVREGLRAPLARRSACRLRLAAQGAERRHPQEPGRTTPRHPPAGARRRASRCRASRRPCAPATRPRPNARPCCETPPHILVTTPESLYLLLTAERSRQMLRTVRTVIVDEIHAVIGTRRGAHLALSLERLEAVCAESAAQRAPRLQRIGLSATQKPIEEVARFLVGNDEHASGDCVDHRRGAPPRDRPGHRDAALAARPR